MYDTGFWGLKRGSPGFHSDNRWRSRMPPNHVRFDDRFQIELVPVLRCLLQHRVQIGGIGDDFAGCFGPLAQNAGQDDDRLTSDVVTKPGDYRVITRHAFPRNLPLKRPDLLWRHLAVDHLPEMVV